jgi:tetratricopeptide (TPR) repeat protein
MKRTLLSIFLAASFLGCGREQIRTPDGDPLKQGWQFYRLGEFKRAAALFQPLTETAPAGSDRQLQALYALATTFNLRRPDPDPARARALYEKIIQTAPAHDLAAWSLLALARMQHLVDVGKTPDYEAVRNAYREVMTRFPGHLAAKEAYIYYYATLMATLEDQPVREAIAALEKFVATEKKEFLQPAWSLLAVGYTTTGEPGKRLQAEIRSLETTEIDPTNPFNDFAWALWNIATIAEFEAGDPATARLYYRRLIHEYPQDQKVHGARKALERLDELEKNIREGRS